MNLTFSQLLERVEQACKNGVGIVQLREKECSTLEFIEMAKKMMEVTHKYNVPLVVNDRVDVALVANTDGVHVGLEDMSVADARRLLGEEKIVGSTSKTIERAQSSELEGADYLGTGAIFPPTVKVKTHHTSIKKLGEIARSVKIPTLAISGINRGNLDELIGSPIVGIAVIEPILEADDSGLETRLMKQDVLKKIIKNNGL
jgi:thiamine-phosphate pyrophosphorylase